MTDSLGVILNVRWASETILAQDSLNLLVLYHLFHLPSPLQPPVLPLHWQKEKGHEFFHDHLVPSTVTPATPTCPPTQEPCICLRGAPSCCKLVCWSWAEKYPARGHLVQSPSDVTDIRKSHSVFHILWKDLERQDPSETSARSFTV